jgi:hypothetical protein
MFFICWNNFFYLAQRTPLFVTKGDREKEIVAMYLEDFLEILRKIKK